MADFSAQGLIQGSTLGPSQSTPGEIPGQHLLAVGGGGAGIITYFRMRGVDNGTSAYTTWPVTGAPDPNGAQATAGNTTPTLVGSIVAGSGIVLTSWQQ